MSVKNVLIEPISVSGSECSISLLYLDFNQSATFKVQVYSDDKRVCILDTIVAMVGQDYQNWTNNDDYAIDFCLTQCGLKRV